MSYICGLLIQMFSRLRKRGHTREFAEMAAAMATETIAYAGWDHDGKNWSRARIVAIGVLGFFAGETLMKARTEELPQIDDEAVAGQIYDFLLKHSTEAARKSAISYCERVYKELRAWLYEPGTKMNPIHDQCVHKFARFLVENSKDPLKELAEETLPALEDWCRDAMARWEETPS